MLAGWPFWQANPPNITFESPPPSTEPWLKGMDTSRVRRNQIIKKGILAPKRYHSNVRRDPGDQKRKGLNTVAVVLPLSRVDRVWASTLSFHPGSQPISLLGGGSVRVRARACVLNHCKSLNRSLLWLESDEPGHHSLTPMHLHFFGCSRNSSAPAGVKGQKAKVISGLSRIGLWLWWQ